MHMRRDWLQNLHVTEWWQSAAAPGARDVHVKQVMASNGIQQTLKRKRTRKRVGRILPAALPLNSRCASPAVWPHSNLPESETWLLSVLARTQRSRDKPSRSCPPPRQRSSSSNRGGVLCQPIKGTSPMRFIWWIKVSNGFSPNAPCLFQMDCPLSLWD